MNRLAGKMNKKIQIVLKELFTRKFHVTRFFKPKTESKLNSKIKSKFIAFYSTFFELTTAKFIVAVEFVGIQAKKNHKSTC